MFGGRTMMCTYDHNTCGTPHHTHKQCMWVRHTTTGLKTHAQSQHSTHTAWACTWLGTTHVYGHAWCDHTCVLCCVPHTNTKTHTVVLSQHTHMGARYTRMHTSTHRHIDHMHVHETCDSDVRNETKTWPTQGGRSQCISSR